MMLVFILLVFVTSSIMYSSCADEASAKAYLEEQASLGVSEHDLLEKAIEDFSIIEKMTYFKNVNTTDGTKRQIFFGTNWCGKGNISEGGKYENLGSSKEVDMCCRDHDHCAYQIHEGNQRWGLVNPEDYTITDCRCDDKFYKCLKDVDSITAWSVGTFFFTGLAAPCVKIDKDADMNEQESSAKTKYNKPQKAHLRESETYIKKKAEKKKSQKQKKKQEKKEKEEKQ